MSGPLLTDTSLAILAVAVALGVYIRLFSGYTALVHPLLLGKQSEVSPTRQKGQTGIFRNWATGHGSPLSLRPSNALKTVADLLDQSCTARDIFGVKISNDLLNLRAVNVGRGLAGVVDLSSCNGVLNLLPDGFNSLLLTLAVAHLPEGQRTHLHALSTPQLLAHILALPSPPQILVLPCKLLQPVLEQLVDEEEETQARNRISIVIAGSQDELEGARESRELARSHGVAVYDMLELERAGDKGGEGKDLSEKTAGPAESDLLCVCWSESVASEEPIKVELTHRAIIAGISASLALFPAHKRPSPTSNDTIASCIPLTQPIGLSLAFSALWSGAGFRTFGSAHGWGAHVEDIAPALDACAPLAELLSLMDPQAAAPSIVILSSAQLQDLTAAVRSSARRNPLLALALRHKLAGIFDGHLAREGIWERLVWKNARSSAVGGLASTLRSVIVVDPKIAPSELQTAQAYLSLPITRLTTSSLSASPLFLSHFFDVQFIPTSSLATPSSKEFSFTPTSSSRAPLATKKNTVHAEYEVAGGEGYVHSGPPSINVEVMLKGVEEEVLEDVASDPEGDVWIRGPGVPVNLARSDKGWVTTGLRAKVLKNGTFVVAH